MSLSHHIRHSKPGHDPSIIAGYSIEMLDNGIRELSAVPNPGHWEVERLKLLRQERSARADS